MDPLSGAASVIAVLQLSGKVVQYINNALGAKEDRRRLRDQVRACQNILQSLKDESDDSEEGKAWISTIQALEGKDNDAPLARIRMILTLVEMRLSTKDNVFQSLKWPFREKEVEKLIETLEREKSLLILALNNNSGRLLQELIVRSKEQSKYIKELRELLIQSSEDQRMDTEAIKSGLFDIDLSQKGVRIDVGRLIAQQEDQAISKKREIIIEWLSPVDHASIQSEAIRRREPDTGAWLLNSIEYQNWLNSEGKTLFCPGIPGAGKTIMTSIVVDDLYHRYGQDSTAGIAFLYCDYRLKDTQSMEELLRSVLKQLLQRQAHLSRLVEEIYEKGDITRDIPVVLHAVATPFRRVFILVDALDECPTIDGCLWRFLKELFTLQERLQVNLWATSRKIPEILKKFSGTIQIEIRANREDVNRYLRSQVEHLPEAVRTDSAFQEEITTSILESIDGMFLLAYLHIGSLVGKRSKKSIRAALRALGKGSEAYDTAYRETMKRIMAQPGDQPRVAFDALGWVICAQRPLIAVELEEALMVEEGESKLDPENRTSIHHMISVCAGLLTVQEGTNVVQLVHYTTQDFFERTKSEWFPGADAKISNTCITYLSFEAFRQSAGIINERILHNSILVHRLYDYVSLHWGDHARACPSSYMSTIMKFLEQDNERGSVLVALDRHMCLWPYNFRSRSRTEDLTTLHVAAFFGLEEVVVQLLKRDNKTNVDMQHKLENSQIKYYNTPLMLAARRGHSAVVTRLIESNAAVNFMNHRCETAILLAARNGHVAVTKILLWNNAVLDARCARAGATVIGGAAVNGHEKVVQLLLDRSNDEAKRFALFDAAERGHENIVKMLVEHDLSSGIASALYISALKGHESLVRILIKTAAGKNALNEKNPRGALRNFQDNSASETPLVAAARMGHISIARSLVEAGADINIAVMDDDTAKIAVDEEGGYSFLEPPGRNVRIRVDNNHTAFYAAAKEGLEAMTDFLSQSGAHINSHASSNALFVVLCRKTHGARSAAVRLLLHHDANANAVDGHGRTPLFIACLLGDETVVKLLLEFGANVNLQTDEGEFPFHWLSRNETVHTEKRMIGTAGATFQTWTHVDQDAIARLLIAAGADVNQQDGRGRSPLAIACGKRRECLVTAYLALGANANSRDQAGQTPLLQLLRKAIARSKTKALKSLLVHGADPNISSMVGETPLSMALNMYRNMENSSQSYLEFVQILLDAGANPNQPDETGTTPLAIAETIRSKIQLKLSKLDDMKGWRLRHESILEQFKSIIQLLENSGASS